MDRLILTYFDVDGGRAEPTRLALHLGGIRFEDQRFGFADFAEVRSHTPLNQVPTLRVGELLVTQSDAILRYAGKLAGLYPRDELQALLCDEVIAALEDLNVRIVATFGLADAALREARAALAGDALPRYLRWLERQLAARGGAFLADGRLTIADLKAFVMLRWLGSGKLDHLPADLIDSVAPELPGYVARIAATPAIEQYYRARAAACGASPRMP